MAIISKKKIQLKVNTVLKNYLISSERSINLPVSYKDLNEYEESFPMEDPLFEEPRWETVIFPIQQQQQIHQNLIKTYSYLKTEGDSSLMKHLFVDRIDHYIYGETKPFRIRIVNRHNNNQDYFYIKVADASRIYGLEFEHYLTTNRINYIVGNDTIAEEHIPGIQGDVFVYEHVFNNDLDKVRLAREFVKFNERCFIRLLGDMHPGNFVLVNNFDLEGIHYRIRPIDFDQQSYEGKKDVYVPLHYKRNSFFTDLVNTFLDNESIQLYKKEEKAIVLKRIRTSHNQIKKLTEAMARDVTSFPSNILLLKEQLAEHYKEKEFLTCKNMGEVLVISLKQLFKK